jgi:hypothetical protein
MPDQIGSHRLLKRVTLSRETIDELGTDRYVLARYRDESSPEGAPGAVIDLLVGYYTGILDSSPHLTNLCQVAGGVEAHDPQPIQIPLLGASLVSMPDGSTAARPRQGDPIPLPGPVVPASAFSFTLKARPDPVVVVYFHYANGHWLATPEQVRRAVADPRAPAAYWARIELMTESVARPADAPSALAPFLSALMPELMACLPPVPPRSAFARAVRPLPFDPLPIPLPNSAMMILALLAGLASCTRFKSKQSRKHYN